MINRPANEALGDIMPSMSEAVGRDGIVFIQGVHKVQQPLLTFLIVKPFKKAVTYRPSMG